MKPLLAALLLLATAAAAEPAPKPAPGAPQVGTYQGVLPCASCAGVRTKLTLYGPPAFKYRIERHYIGREPNPFVDQGTYYILRGNAVDPDATVFELGADSGEYFQRVSDDELRRLDREQRPILGPANQSLRRVR